MKRVKLKNLLTLMAVTLVASVIILPTKASAAWRQSDSGNWNYTEENSLVSGWKSIDGTWYFFDSNKNMKTGWVNDGGTWYYLASSGAMKTGWVNDGGKWYHNTSSGAMQTGWLLDNGVWYYLNSSGAMQTGLVDINNKTYYLSESGAMKTGNITVNGVNYKFAESGEKVNSPTTNQTTSEQSTIDSTTSNNSGSSVSSGSGTDESESYYESLYGTWSVTDYIPSDIKVSGTQLDADTAAYLIGESFKIKSNKITSDSVGVTISNPRIKEGTLSSSAFDKKYKDTLENIGISGDSVKYVTITNPDDSAQTVTIFIADNEDVYALLEGALFELEKQ